MGFGPQNFPPAAGLQPHFWAFQHVWTFRFFSSKILVDNKGGIVHKGGGIVHKDCIDSERRNEIPRNWLQRTGYVVKTYFILWKLNSHYFISEMKISSFNNHLFHHFYFIISLFHHSTAAYFINEISTFHHFIIQQRVFHHFYFIISLFHHSTNVVHHFYFIISSFHHSTAEHEH